MSQQKDNWGVKVFSDETLNEFTIRTHCFTNEDLSSSTIASLAHQLLDARTKIKHLQVIVDNVAQL